MADKRWDVEFHNQWRAGGYSAFSLIHVGCERLKRDDRQPGYVGVWLSLCGFGLTVVRYGA